MSNDSIINRFVNNLPFELHLVDPYVGKYAACGPGTKHYERIKKYIITRNIDNVYKNKLDKACFAHDSAYSKYKDVPNRQIADKQLMDQALNIANDQNIDGYQRSLAGMVYNFFNKKIQMGQGWNDELAEELHKPVRRKFPRRSVIVYSVDDIWGADLVDMREWEKYNKGYVYMLTVIDVMSKYAWAIPLKDKKGETVTAALKQIIAESGRKPDHLWVDEGGEFYNKKMKAYLENNNINMYSTYSENKSAVVERFNRTLKTNMWKKFTAKNTRNWIDMLEQLMNDYNNRKHSTIKMSPTKASELTGPIINSKQQLAKPKFKIGDTVRISRVKGLFEKGYLPNWSEQVYKIIKIKQTIPTTYIIADLKGEVIKGSFYEQELQKTDQSVFRIEKVIRKKKINGKQYGLVKWIGYNKDFNEWLPMSEIDII
jgi:transposase InsO family protein